VVAGADERVVLVVTGASAEVACWHQKAGGADAPILWDYHVVLAARAGAAWSIWDLDGRLGAPVAARAWLGTTFPLPALVPARHQPRFEWIAADEYVRGFGSDRSHMRTPDGGWQREPPAWPPIDGAGRALTLSALRARARDGLDLAALTARLS
jgi:hypothetical protein